MRVGLNLVYLVPGATGGTETYARELIPALVAAAPATRFTAFVNREAAASAQPAPWGELIPAVTLPVNASKRHEWVRGEQLHLPRVAAAHGVDLVHSLANTGPLRGRFRRVVTIHDLQFRLTPEAHLGFKGAGMRLLVPAAARSAHRVIVPSAATGRDVEQMLHVPARRIDLVPEGHGAVERGAAALDAAAVRRWLGAGDRPIVLSVSAKRPHKNLARLITAVSSLPPEHRPLLVIPGYPTAHERELHRHAEALDVADHVRLLGWVDDARLEGLYATAGCLVCASMHEGFGLPVLEAMSRGLPVACSDRGALAEVANGAALLFNPESVEQIAAAIQRLLGDPPLCERLRAAGVEQATRFTWAAAAAGTLASYERALQRAPQHADQAR